MKTPEELEQRRKQIQGQTTEEWLEEYGPVEGEEAIAPDDTEDAA